MTLVSCGDKENFSVKKSAKKTTEENHRLLLSYCIDPNGHYRINRHFRLLQTKPQHSCPTELQDDVQESLKHSEQLKTFNESQLAVKLLIFKGFRTC